MSAEFSNDALAMPLSYIPEASATNSDMATYASLAAAAPMQLSSASAFGFESNTEGFIQPQQATALTPTLPNSNIPESQNQEDNPHRQIIMELQQNNKQLRSEVERYRRIIQEAREHTDRLSELQEGFAIELLPSRPEHHGRIKKLFSVVRGLRNSLG